MKKVLLSLSMLAAMMSANAQSVGTGAFDDIANVVEYNNPTNNSGIYYWTDACYPAMFPNFSAASTNPVIADGVARRENGVLTVSIDKTQTTGTGAALCPANNEYSPFGLNFGDDNGAAPSGTAFTIDITTAKTFSCSIKASANVTVRVQIEDINGKKLEAPAGSTGGNGAYEKAVTTTSSTWTIDLTGGVGLSWPGPVLITGFDYTQVAKVMWFVQPGASTFNGTVTLDNIKIGHTANVGLATTAASNIGSTKVFPNPSTTSFTAEVNLNNAANTTIIVTDMLGKQVASQNLGTVTSSKAEFNTSSLAKGMYTVTYVLDGAPAKTELVVVK